MSACVFCSLSSKFYFVDDKISADCFKDKITPSLKSNYRLNFVQDVGMNNLIDKGKTRYKFLYKIFKEQDGYDPLLDISTFSTLIQLKEFIDGVQHCVTVVGKWIFDSNSTLSLPITTDNGYHCCINYNENN